MSRRVSAIALVMALWALLLLPGTTAAYTKNLAWAPSAGGALKSYTFDAYSTRCRAGYRLRIEFELGKVTATSAYIRSVRFYYSRYNNIFYTTADVFDHREVERPCRGDQVLKRGPFREPLDAEVRRVHPQEHCGRP